jgi:hypothetical protein
VKNPLIAPAVAVVSALFVAAVAVAPAAAELPREGDVRFKVTCQHSHTLADDPIVFPNQPGVSHLHDFNGNETVDASTTTYSQLLAGTTTCNDPEDLAGYWTPQVKVNGQVREPDRMTGYYRRGGKAGLIEPYPDGLKIIAGYDMMGQGHWSGRSGWQCNGANSPSNNTNGCTTNLTMVVEFPDCWDGVNTDWQPNHRDHMTYAIYINGVNVCPEEYPVPVPELTTYTHYGDIPLGAAVTLSSGAVNTVHGDFFNGWVAARQQALITYCLNGIPDGYQKCDSGGASIP